MLQLLWLMRRLRPSGVSFGSMLTQLDCAEQSPQPSHTASKMNIRRSGSSNSPRLRRRRFSAAQVCSYSSTVQPGVSRSSRWMASMRSRCSMRTPAGSALALWRDGSSLTSTSVFTPSCTTWWAICAGEMGPSTGCPPVMATASL